MKRTRKTSQGILLILLIAIQFVPRQASACSPDEPLFIFAYASHPDLPLENFAAGHPGIIQPTWARSYLIATWRMLDERPFNAGEQRELAALWQYRLQWNRTTDEGADEDRLNAWLKARKQVVRQPPADAPIKTVVTKWTSQLSMTCDAGAFNGAIKTLHERISTHGARNKWVTEWVKAQDFVFSHCMDDAMPALPAPPVGAPQWLLQDHDYQMASVRFHSNDASAEAAFAGIARDTASPWRPMATYILLRLRRRILGAFPQTARPEVRAEMSALHDEAKERRAEPGMRPARQAFNEMLGFTELRLDAPALVRRLSTALRSGRPEESLTRDLNLLIAGMDELRRDSGGAWREALRGGAQDPLPDSSRSLDELVDWLSTIQSGLPTDYAHSLSRWRQNRRTAWLLAALWKLPAGDSATEELLTAAGKIPESSPGFLTAGYLRVRAFAADGRLNLASAELDSRLQDPQRLPPTARIMFLSLRLRTSRTQPEFISALARHPLSVSDEQGRELTDTRNPRAVEASYFGESLKGYHSDEPHLGLDGALLLNAHFPARALLDLANDETLPDHVRRELVIAAWTHAALLGDHDLAREATPVLEILAPELKDSLAQYLAAGTVDERDYAVAFMLLRNPGLHPYVRPGPGRVAALKLNVDLERNGWCAHNPWRELGMRNIDDEYPRLRLRWGTPLPARLPRSFANLLPLPPFVPAEQEQQSVMELQALGKLEGFPNFLSRSAIAWAKAHPDDPRNPEALLWSLRATSNLNTCVNDETPALAAEAYALLTKRYPKNRWTKMAHRWI